MNLVRLRCGDRPIFLAVPSIVNSYTWEAGANVGATFGPNIDQQNTLGARGTF